MMDKRFQELSTLGFKKVDIGLRETELIKQYAELKFNGGFALETIECNDSEKFKKYLKSMYPTTDDGDMMRSTRPAANDVKDFMYCLLGNQGLAGLGIYLGNGEEFLSIDPPHDSLEGFRKLAFTELNEQELKKMLFHNAMNGSIYDDWKASGELTSEMIDDFMNQLFPEDGHFRIIHFQQWGNFMIGLFEGFIFMDIDQGRLTFFATDDYD